MATAQLVVRIAELLLFGVLGIASLRRWRTQRDQAGVWASATFGVLGLVVLTSFVLDPHSESDAASWARKVLVAVLLLFPYFLFRYGDVFRAQSRRMHWLAASLTGVVLVWTFLLGKLHGSDSPRSDALDVFVFGVLVQWTVLSASAASALWRAGKGQATVVRKRMRMLAMGSAVLNLALIIAAFAPSDEHSAGPVITGVIAILSAVFFFMGFIAPRGLRMMWRSPDSQTLRDAEVSLMSVLDPSDIGGALLPYVARLFGGQGSVLVDRAGGVIAAYGLTSEEAKATAMVAANSGAEPIVDSSLLSVPMRHGWLAVRGSVVTPFFGRDEVDLLVGLGVFADLALERGELFVRERAARELAERANAELETFVYSVSHDLKSPLVSLLGFLDYLKDDLEQQGISDDTRFFVSRISAASMYMQALIQDLLELSRIGRVQTEATSVDLDAVLNEVVEELALTHDQASITLGALPVVEMNPLRARQLFTNLVNNALVHSGRADVAITVSSAVEPSGGVVVRVADNGQGIPADYRDRVFGVFERLERPEANTTSTGIGLAVCRKIADQCGAEIAIEDNNPGAAFVIRFPAAAVRRGPTELEAVR